MYQQEIDELLNQGIMGSKIEEIIRTKGYVGSSSTVRHYISEWKKRFKQSTSTDTSYDKKQSKISIKRNDIFKVLFKPLKEIRNLSTELFETFCTQYPCFKIVWAVISAIRLPYSNGLAEGSVNKIKVIKRIMYGRCSFDSLRRKTLQLEKMHKFN